MPAITPAPPLACDAHMHVYDARFPHDGKMVNSATADDYRREIQARIGTTRTVVVTPRIYGVDNRVTLDAIQQLGADHTRGVAVLRPDVTDAELVTLHTGGIRGIRFTLYTPVQAVVGFEMVESLSQRVHELGWHVQLHWTAAQIVEHEALLRRLPSKIVFDHLARLSLPEGIDHPAFGIVRSLLDTGRAWLKLSGPYLDSRVGEAQRYSDMDPTAHAWVNAAPERLVWGSDWPHTTETIKPDDTALFDLLSHWVENPAQRRAILVDNPAKLYDF
ncbi:MAG: 2-pyrone-4,6-dicarboxylate hydrolase [Caballeronia sp.]|uniref:amidohydrolase family protein n=1 Tax=Caballeronia sp. TaxID=1931223 RepID=UPI0026307635|nr:amidohydrolase family protein [Caballeronia sp.]MDB5831863.1 2-pyrone-4,6-dicarboxylate hydrolase [Caballeronia sp.]